MVQLDEPKSINEQVPASFADDSNRKFQTFCNENVKENYEIIDRQKKGAFLSREACDNCIRCL